MRGLQRWRRELVADNPLAWRPGPRLSSEKPAGAIQHHKQAWLRLSQSPQADGCNNGQANVHTREAATACSTLTAGLDLAVNTHASHNTRRAKIHASSDADNTDTLAPASRDPPFALPLVQTMPSTHSRACDV